MIGTSLKRIIRNAFINFWRNGLVSVATILVMVLALLMAGALIMSQVLLDAVLAEIEQQVDVSVYFKQDAEETEILRIQNLVRELPEIKTAKYVSKEDALAAFREEWKDNALIGSALDELGYNPLAATLKLQAHSPENYEAIALFLKQGDFEAIDKIDYLEHRVTYETLASVVSTARRVGSAVALLLGFMAFLVAFNTIRLAIYTSREEISIMRLVGASTWYVRGPFLVEGVAHGFFASLIAMLLFWPGTLWFSSKPRLREFFGGVDLFSFYTQNFFLFFFALFMIGVTIGVFSSFVATRRYLKI